MFLRDRAKGFVVAFSLAAPTTSMGIPFADSVVDFPSAGDTGSKQNINGWQYGYHNATLNNTYQTGEFIPFFDNVAAGTSANDFWNNTAWDWHAGNPPWTYIGQINVHPNGTNHISNNDEHWAIRRYTVQPGDLSGPSTLSVNWETKKVNPNGTGVTGIVFHNGVAVDSITTNSTSSQPRQFRLNNVSAGDVIDLAITPLGPSGDRSDGSDGSANYMTLQIANERKPGDVVMNSVADFTGIQGARNWYYGYYQKTGDGNGVFDFATDFTEMLGGADSPEVWGDGQHFTGSAWDFNPLGASDGNPPWTIITADLMHPNDSDPGPEQYAIRRWVSDIEAFVGLTGFFQEANPNGPGTVGKIYLNGVEVFSEAVDGPDTFDFNLLLDLKVGDIIDFMVDTGQYGEPGADGSDATRFQAMMTVRRAAVPEPLTLGLVALGLAGMRFRRRRGPLAR